MHPYIAVALQDAAAKSRGARPKAGRLYSRAMSALNRNPGGGGKERCRCCCCCPQPYQRGQGRAVFFTCTELSNLRSCLSMVSIRFSKFLETPKQLSAPCSRQGPKPYMVPCRRVDSPPRNGMVPPPTLNPKPQTLNPKPQTLNPKP